LNQTEPFSLQGLISAQHMEQEQQGCVMLAAEMFVAQDGKAATVVVGIGSMA